MTNHWKKATVQDTMCMMAPLMIIGVPNDRTE